jgi:hypothetical protein
MATTRGGQTCNNTNQVVGWSRNGMGNLLGDGTASEPILMHLAREFDRLLPSEPLAHHRACVLGLAVTMEHGAHEEAVLVLVALRRGRNRQRHPVVADRDKAVAEERAQVARERALTTRSPYQRGKSRRLRRVGCTRCWAAPPRDCATERGTDLYRFLHT